MTATIPIYAPLADRSTAGEPFPREVRQEHAVGMPEDCAPLVVFLASDAAADITGQAIGIGGDKLTLYTHPAEAEFVYREAAGPRKRSPKHGPSSSRRCARASEWSCRRSISRVDGRVSLDLDAIVAIDVHVHAERNHDEPQDPVTTEILDAAATLLRRPSAAAERPGGRRLLPRAQDAGGDLQRRR